MYNKDFILKIFNLYIPTKGGWLNLKRMLRIVVLFTLFVIVLFIFSLLIYSLLDKFIEIENKSVRYIMIILGSILGVLAIQLIIKRTA